MEHYGAADGALWSTVGATGALMEHYGALKEQLWSTGAAMEH
jgi:hypothetical protein